MTDWSGLVGKETAAVGLVSRYSEIVIKDPELTSEQAEQLLAQIVKGRDALLMIIERMKVSGSEHQAVLTASRLKNIWDGLEKAAIARLEIIRMLEVARPQGSA